MTTSMGWRRFLTFATIDALLMVTAGAAWAAPAAPASASAPSLPVLLLLGVGLVSAAGAGRRRLNFVPIATRDGIGAAGCATLTA